MSRRYALVKHLFHMLYELVHSHIRLIYIIEHIITLRAIVYHKFYERDNVAHICHRFLVVAVANHKKFST